MDRRALVVGARPDSLGAYVVTALTRAGYEVCEAGLSGEHMLLDATNYTAVRRLMRKCRPHAVVCTVGINRPWTILDSEEMGSYDQLHETFAVNTIAPLILLDCWLDTWLSAASSEMGRQVLLPNESKTFVAVSSNSAHVARSQSLAYCASKAALSMALRCAARDVAKAGYRSLHVYGYEPCWLEDTPMSADITHRLLADATGKDMPLHRVPGGTGLDPHKLAQLIVTNLDHGAVLHGTLLRTDLGDQ